MHTCGTHIYMQEKYPYNMKIKINERLGIGWRAMASPHMKKVFLVCFFFLKPGFNTSQVPNTNLLQKC